MAELGSLVLAIAGGIDVSVRTCFVVSQLIHEWKDAPVQMNSLSEEIANSRNTAMQLKDFCERLNANESLDVAYALVISNQVRKAEPLWVELERIMQSLKSPRGRLRKERWIKNARRVSSLQEELRGLRSATLEILSIYTASRSIRIESAIATVQNSQKVWFETATQSLSDTLSRLEAEKVATHQASMSSNDGLLRKGGNKDDRPEELGTLAVARDACATMRYLDGPGPRCSFLCRCRCHQGRKYGRFRVAPFQSILGSLQIAYSGWELTGPHCDIRSCLRARFKLLEVTYYTPSQPFGSIRIIASLRILDDEPTIGLTIGRNVTVVNEHDSQSILNFSKAGRTAELRRTLEKRPTAVLDVNKQRGWSSLHYALEHNYLEMVKDLLAGGADPFLEDDYGLPAIHVGFQAMMGGVVDAQSEQELKDCLPISTFLDDYNFSHIQRVVLQIRPLDLQVELNKAMYRAEVNVQDSLGSTPLHWAAIRGDVLAVNILLHAGANVHIRDKSGGTALYEACASNSEGCAASIIAFNAEVNARRKTGYSPIHAAASRSASRCLLSLLLSHGADIEDSDNMWKSSPLERATGIGAKRSEGAHTARDLLELGANIEHVDACGATPLFNAIVYNAHAAIQLLLSWKVNYLHKNFRKQTIVHVAAQTGDQRTFEILGAGNMSGFDVDANDKDSMNARQYFARRSGVSQGTKDSFEALIRSLLEEKVRSEDHVEGNNDNEEFFDALESPE